jgi:hypothetical protein
LGNRAANLAAAAAGAILATGVKQAYNFVTTPTNTNAQPTNIHNTQPEPTVQNNTPTITSQNNQPLTSAHSQPLHNNPIMNRPTMSEPPHHTGIFPHYPYNHPPRYYPSPGSTLVQETDNEPSAPPHVPGFPHDHPQYQALHPTELTNSDPSPATLNPLFYEMDAMAKPQSHTPSRV